MSETECEKLHRSAAELHDQAERGMREAVATKDDKAAFVEKVGDVARCEAQAKAVEKRIEENC